MWDLAVDEAGSITFENGQLKKLYNKDATMQSIKLAILTWKGSHKDNPNFGMDWNHVFTNPYNLPFNQLIEMELNSLMASGFDPNIYSFSYVNAEVQDRNVSITCDVVLRNSERMRFTQEVSL